MIGKQTERSTVSAVQPQPSQAWIPIHQSEHYKPALRWGILSALGIVLASCSSIPGLGPSGGQGFEVRFLLGSALGHFCDRAAEEFNATNPQLSNGDRFYLTCDARGSGDVVTTVVDLARDLQQGSVSPDDPAFPTLISVDGEVYHSQLRYRVEQLFPGQNYIPEIIEAPLLANSPMVFMTSSELAEGLRSQPDIFEALVAADNHTEFDADGPPLPIYYVHTAPTRSNSGLQTLIAQFAAVADTPPEQLEFDDVQRYQADIQQIQGKVTRYGASTSSLARDMVANGPFWASIASVYESSVITANTESTGGDRYEAIYPEATFTSNMRAILPDAPWVSEAEREAAMLAIEFFRTPEIQRIATDFGLRPGVPGIPLGPRFTSQYGVDPDATYDSLRPPQPEVVDAMLNSWLEFAKRPSQVVVVVDSSGSMEGEKIAAVRNTLRTYVESLGPQEEIVLIDFDTTIRNPVLVDGSDAGIVRGYQFIGGLRADGATLLFDATLAARDWLRANLEPEAINAIVVLTDGEDSGSSANFEQLLAELERSSFQGDERIAVFTIGYGDRGSFNPTVLERMADISGGYFREGDPASISRLMSNLQVEF